VNLHLTSAFIVLLLISSVRARGAETMDVDICVYGGTSGAIAAAVQAKRMNKTVVVVSPDRFLGGMTSGGLGFTDIGDERILGGLSHEFFNRVYNHYQKDTAWNFEPREKFGNKGQGGLAMNHKAKTMSLFEPKVAAMVFDEWIKENQIQVLRSKLDRSKSGIVKNGNSIISIRTLDGHTIRAKIFVDATYEGDLMALAGVSYTTGREAASQYGESANGIQPEHQGNQLPRGIDPYVTPKDSSSGLLPGVNSGTGGDKGAGDKRLQAYCYRMCLTNHDANKIAISKPEGYHEKDYEIVFRATEAGQKNRFFKFSALPNYKTDSNNDSGASTDFIGMNYDYPEADYATREKIAKAHENWQLGLIWTLQHHPRVPEEIRKRHLLWGLPKDEFLENGNWAHALYVREARRMVGDYVATQKIVSNKEDVPRSIGMGAYKMDSHHVQRYVTTQGDVQNEGDVQASINGPYRIDYGTIVPKKDECDNLFVTFCVSASHIAFGSIRMEPVFMVLSQSAVTAGAIAIDGKMAVQDVPYDVLKNRLLADGQRLTLGLTEMTPRK
jgi:hypothetical protein